MASYARKTGDWKAVENKLRSISAESKSLIADSSKTIPAEYQRTIRGELMKWKVQPTEENPAFDSSDYAAEVKPYPETTSKGTEVFVGLQEPVKPEMRNFALSAEFESEEHMGIWRKATSRFLATLENLQNGFWDRVANWNIYRRKT
jgi:hypothetical protein